MSDTIKYETKFDCGTLITDYLATAYVEGFCEGEGASSRDMLKAFSYMCGTGLHKRLQGWFGREVQVLIANNIMNSQGIVNWDLVDNAMQFDITD